MIRRLFAIAGALVLSACAAVERSALPSAELLSPDWTVTAPAPGNDVDYRAYAAFIDTYTAPDPKGIVRVAYGQVAPEDRAQLDQAIKILEDTDPATLTRDQQLVYWINLYNAATIRLILQNYPVESIRDIKDGTFSFGPWDRQVLLVKGQRLSLNDIEHRIIRPIYNEPRIHYALNCAAAGCPNLKFWSVDGLDADLEAAERAYVNDPRGVNIGPDGQVTLSKIYNWFREDFGANEAEVLQRLTAKADPEVAKALTARGRIDRFDYDWSLNER